MIQDARIHPLNELPEKPEAAYVLYWMQQAMRTRGNHALEYAIRRANALGLPCVVCYGIMDDYPEANERHYAFMVEGLRDVAANLKARGIRFVVRHGSPEEAAVHYAKDAAAVVCDVGYTRHQRGWRDAVADGCDVRVTAVESDVVVPVEAYTDKHEYAARTIRGKIHKQWEAYLVPVGQQTVKHPSSRLQVSGNVDVSDVDATLKNLKLDRSVKQTSYFKGGEDEAGRQVERFIQAKLDNYAAGRNEPADAQSSVMSPFLHFGQVSPVELALAVRDTKKAPAVDRDSYLEEMIIRRELSMNFCHFAPNYDQYDCLPDWAKKTLHKHAKDKRPVTYTREQLETAQTHDPYWNAAQLQMVISGFMHNYMRMYWGKKILEWTKTPEEAFATNLAINNKFFLDGRDPNSFANVAWVYGLHDRPWQERPIFGTVRYMVSTGLERKFDMQKYVAAVHDLVQEQKYTLQKADALSLG